MCGIAGMIRFGNEPITEEILSLLLVGNEHRGNDASGIALAQADGTVDVCKSDSPPWKFVSSKQWEEFIEKNLHEDTWAAMVHARGATTGNPRNNVNNHPLYAGVSAAIHNGVIRNDDWLFKDLKLERRAETDSDIIRAIVDAGGINQNTVKTLNKIAGGVASCVFDPRSPKKLFLMRSGNPICLASSEQSLFFASEKGTLHRALKPMVERFGIWFQANRPGVAFGTVPDDTCWIIGEKGVEWHGPFKTLLSTYHEPVRQVYDNYTERSQRFDRESGSKHTNIQTKEMEDAWCPTCKKTWAIEKGKSPSEFTCNKTNRGCGGTLVAIPSA